MAGILEATVASVSAVTVALIGGAFAIRNARKTPHETLKSLLELLKDPDISSGDRVVLQDATHREIARIGMLNTARLEGFWAFQRARFLGGMSPFTQRALFTAIILPALTIPTAWVWPVSLSDNFPGLTVDYAVATYKSGEGGAGDLTWSVDRDWGWGHLVDHYIISPPFPTWLVMVAYILVIVAVILLTRVGVAAARTHHILRALASFGMFALICQLVTYVVYRILGHLATNPQAWYLVYQLGDGCESERMTGVAMPPGTTSWGQEKVYACVQWEHFTEPDLLGYTWIQPGLQVWMFCIIVGWVVVSSLLLRYGPGVFRRLAYGLSRLPSLLGRLWRWIRTHL
ncbi:hypothetical protein ACFVUS_20140 [Nocardia sp. NPDC058058]|uniref:hypothetical protein n=1 Tax=Nocardia sp. NPDC058058 TaxID=3346317 RepID=UPI0036DAB53E